MRRRLAPSNLKSGFKLLKQLLRVKRSFSVVNYRPSSRKQACKLITQHAAGWRWSGTSGLVAYRCSTFAMPTVPCMGTTTVPCLGTSTVPCLGTFASAQCLGTFAVPVWDACQFPAWERLPVPCLGTLASVHALPGHACSPCLGRLPVPCLGTLASSLPGKVCQCPAWTRFAFPAWDALPVPCLGTFAKALRGYVCQSLPGTLASSLPGNAICWDAVPS